MAAEQTELQCSVIQRVDVESVTLFVCECGLWVPFGTAKRDTRKVIHDSEIPHYRIEAR